MKIIPSELYSKFMLISEQVRKTMRRKGLSIPVANTDGTVRLGEYTIIKNSKDFYSIVDKKGDTVINDINLPQTAAIVANNLSVGLTSNNELIERDREYGYALFEELVQKRAAQRSVREDPDYAELMVSKCLNAKDKKESCKRFIVRNFDKLKKLA